MKKELLGAVKLIIFGFVIVLGINYVFAWTPPPSTPPSNNPPLPLTVGESQSKTGGLYIGGATSIGKTTEPAQNVTLDIMGSSITRGLLVQGAQSIIPANSTLDDILFKIFKNYGSTQVPTFWVDTRSSSEGAYTNNLYVVNKTETKSLLVKDDVNFNNLKTSNTVNLGIDSPSSGYFNLNITGRSNIGTSSGYCVISDSDTLTKGCPPGTYVANVLPQEVPPVSRTEAIWCRSFDVPGPFSFLSGENCYLKPPIYPYFLKFNDNNLSSSCDAIVDLMGAYEGGGVSTSKSYWFYKKINDGNYVSLFQTPCSSNSSSCYVNLGSRKSSGFTAYIKLIIEDGNGMKNQTIKSIKFDASPLCGGSS